MSYKIVVDSCCDLTPEKKADGHFQIIPLTLEVGGKTYIDDETFNQKEYIAAVAASPDCPRTSCPSPGAYKDAYEGEEEMVFVVTLSQHLSGSYNSALVGKNMFEEEYPESRKQIHVFSSDSACCGESLTAFEIQRCCEAGMSFDEIVRTVSDFIYNMKTYFVLEDMDPLKKNGRLTGLAALVVTALNIRPVMAGDHGVIVKVGQSRGIDRALKTMVKHAIASGTDLEHKTLGITHVNCRERAEWVRSLLLEKAVFREVYLTDAAGVSTTYAGDGGIVVTF